MRRIIDLFVRFSFLFGFQADGVERLVLPFKKLTEGCRCKFKPPTSRAFRGQESNPALISITGGLVNSFLLVQMRLKNRLDFEDRKNYQGEMRACSLRDICKRHSIISTRGNLLFFSVLGSFASSSIYSKASPAVTGLGFCPNLLYTFYCPPSRIFPYSL